MAALTRDYTYAKELLDIFLHPHAVKPLADVADAQDAMLNVKCAGHNLGVLDLHGWEVPQGDTMEQSTIFRCAKEADEWVLTRSSEAVASAPLVFKPFHFFFYGSLQSRGQLRNVCCIPGDVAVVLEPASIEGWRAMMWGRYPALVPAEDDEVEGEVEGMVWKCDRPDYANRLGCYETSAYHLQRTEIKTESGELIENGRVFVYADGPEGLRPGVFDLAAYEARWK
jgi:hypothetical protein